MHDHVHGKYLKIYTQNNPLEKICEFNTIVGSKINTYKSTISLHTSNEQVKMK